MRAIAPEGLENSVAASDDGTPDSAGRDRNNELPHFGMAEANPARRGRSTPRRSTPRRSTRGGEPHTPQVREELGGGAEDAGVTVSHNAETFTHIWTHRVQFAAIKSKHSIVNVIGQSISVKGTSHIIPKAQNEGRTKIPTVAVLVHLRVVGYLKRSNREVRRPIG